MTDRFDCVIVGTGPAGLGAAFTLAEKRPGMSMLLIDASGTSTGGLCNDCKMNFTFPIGFPLDCWEEEQAGRYLEAVTAHLRPQILSKHNIDVYERRAEKLGVTLIEVRQSHLGTDGGVTLAQKLIGDIQARGARVSLKETMTGVREADRILITDRREIGYGSLVVAPGRKGFAFMQQLMDSLGVPYIDNIVDIGLRLETREANYPIVRDYYDPKFLFPEKVRTFCTNSGKAFVVKEKYSTRTGRDYFSVNGHAFSQRGRASGLVNFALLKTVRFTAPLASGQEFAEMLGLQAMLMGGGQPLMQRVGDFRLGKRSKAESFTGDLYDFEPTLASCTPGDIIARHAGKGAAGDLEIDEVTRYDHPRRPAPLDGDVLSRDQALREQAALPRRPFPGQTRRLPGRRRGGHEPGHHRRVGERDPSRGRHPGAILTPTVPRSARGSSWASPASLEPSRT